MKKDYQAMMSISRVSGGKTPLFGSKVMHDAYIRVQVRHCEVERKYGQDWFSPKESLIDLEMSNIQFADLITNMNTTGIPVTLRSVSDQTCERPSDSIVDLIGKIQADLNLSDDDVKERINKVASELEKYANEGKQVPVKVARELLNKLETANRNYDGDRNFYKKQAQSEIDSMLVEAKTAFESHIAHRVLELGLKPENFFLTQNSEEDKNEKSN